MGEFLGKILTDSEIKFLIESTSFKKMKQDETILKKDNRHVEIFKPDLVFFRKGEIGDWKNYFDEEMSKRVDEIVKNKLEFKIEFVYEN